MSSLFARQPLHPVTVCGHDFSKSTHICALFDSSQEEDACVLPYFAEGLAQGEQVFTIRDGTARDEHLSMLRANLPMPLDPCMESGQFKILTSEDTYLQDGCFESERMYNMLAEVLEGAQSGKYGRVRTCGDMSWVLRNMPGTDELMEYEARVNDLLGDHDCALMCVYDVNQFSGRAVMDILSTHPTVVMNDRVYENPYFVEPKSFLKTLLRRGSAPLLKETEPA